MKNIIYLQFFKIYCVVKFSLKKVYCNMKTFVWSFIIFMVTLALIFAIIFAPPYLKSQQEKRDRSIGCQQYRQMFELSQESHIINPAGKKWVRESMAAQGLMKKYKCTAVEPRIRIN